MNAFVSKKSHSVQLTGVHVVIGLLIVVHSTALFLGSSSAQEPEWSPPGVGKEASGIERRSAAPRLSRENIGKYLRRITIHISESDAGQRTVTLYIQTPGAKTPPKCSAKLYVDLAGAQLLASDVATTEKEGLVGSEPATTISFEIADELLPAAKLLYVDPPQGFGTHGDQGMRWIHFKDFPNGFVPQVNNAAKAGK